MHASTAPFVPGPQIRIEGRSNGPLVGLTFAAKDLFDVAGQPTGGGNHDWARWHPVPDKHAWAVQRLLDAGATLAFGTDWSVAPLNPVLGIYAAVTRRTLDGKNANGWIPEQRITVEEAVRAYTLGSSFAEFQEGSKGTLTPGKLADIVMLSQDVFTIEPREIEKVKVVLTIMDGRIVYSLR